MASVATDVESVECLPSGLRKFGAGALADQHCSKSGDKLVFRAAAKTPEFFDHLCAHYRETRRTTVDIACDVRIVLADGTVFDEGAAIVRNVSPSGALVTALKLGKGCLPLKPFKVTLILKGNDYKGVGIEATAVRFVVEEAAMGLKFDEVFVTA